MRGNAVPWSPAEMHRIYPDIWKTVKIAEHYLQRTPKHYYNLISEWGFNAVKYKLLNCNGKYYKALVKGDNQRAVLEDIVGKVAEFSL